MKTDKMKEFSLFKNKRNRILQSPTMETMRWSKNNKKRRNSFNFTVIGNLMTIIDTINHDTDQATLVIRKMRRKIRGKNNKKDCRNFTKRYSNRMTHKILKGN